MSSEIEISELENLETELPPSFPSYVIDGVGTVIDHQDGSYIVRGLDNQVHGYPAPGGNCSEENAAADIAAAIASPILPAPQVISRAEFVIAVRRVLGLTEGAIFALIALLPAGETQETARDLWENAREFRRSNSFLVMLAEMNGNTPEQLDEVFRVGAALDLD